MITSLAEALRLTPDELDGWNILSIRGRTSESPLSFPGARRVKTLNFDDVREDNPEEGIFAATTEDIEQAVAFAREAAGEPLLIHCVAGVSRSTALAWIILYDQFKGEGAVRRSFQIVRNLRPILQPNELILRLGVEILVPAAWRAEVMDDFRDCLKELE
jgi:predicted protein tyrosine phosphatase